MSAHESHSATDPEVSAWVSANAGAGKTFLLTDRVTRLLLSGAAPSRILCLTYTKAAAAEMSSRLFARLGEWALLPDDSLRERLLGIGAGAPDADRMRRARQLFAQALETPGGLKIQTIHAFCQNVLSRFPVEAGIAARFSVLDERSAAELMRAARNAVLERAGAGETVLAKAVATLATHAADTRFGDIVDMAMMDSGRLRALLERHGDGARFLLHLKRVLDVGDDADAETIAAGFCETLKKEQPVVRDAAESLSRGGASDRKLADALLKCLEGANEQRSYESLRSAFFTTASSRRQRLVTKKLAEAQPELAAWVEGLCDRFSAAEERRKAAACYALTEAMVTTALAVLSEYDARKRARAALDYDDLIARTLALLDGEDAAAWVLYKLDGGLDHILIDEAQDTSPAQWRIVAKLAEEFFSGSGARERATPRTLFAVGDEKQSIFSFQGAAPEEFAKHLAHFKARAQGAGLAFADVRPLVSRRSATAILSFVDEVFTAEAARDGLTSANAPTAHEPDRAYAGRVEIWPAIAPPPGVDRDSLERPVDAPSPTGAHALLASEIAGRIADWLGSGATRPGTDVPITPGDIMILVRRRNAFAEEMIRQLMARNVRVAGADRMVLLDQIAIADLVALGRFALLPEDDLTLAALLKSPMLGFDEDDLYALAQPRGGRPLWAELSARKDERPLFGEAHAMLAAALNHADYLPPFEFYARALNRQRRRIVARLGDEAADAIDEFLALALAYEGAHPPSLEGFLDWFSHGASEVKRDMEQGGGAVRVMTVHGAKGLEANIVILPDTAQIPDHDRRGILYTEDCTFFPVGKALETPAIMSAKTAAQARELREYRRLLYVALTRARDWLIVCGYQTKQGTHPQSWYPALEAAAKRIGRAEETEGETIWATGLPVGRAGARAPGRTAATPLPAFLTRPAPAETAAPRILRPSQAAGEDEPALLSPASEQGKARFRRGVLIHALLAALPELPRDARETAARNYVARRGIAPEEAEALVRETLCVLDHPTFAALFAEGSRGEIAIAAALPELGPDIRVSGQIDRLAVTADAVLVADFKTNRPPPARAEDTPAMYRAQMALYRAALQRLYPGRRIVCALVWTDNARLMELPDALLDAELAKIRQRQSTQNLV